MVEQRTAAFRAFFSRCGWSVEGGGISSDTFPSGLRVTTRPLWKDRLPQTIAVTTAENRIRKPRSVIQPAGRPNICFFIFLSTPPFTLVSFFLIFFSSPAGVPRPGGRGAGLLRGAGLQVPRAQGRRRFPAGGDVTEGPAGAPAVLKSMVSTSRDEQNFVSGVATFYWPHGKRTRLPAACLLRVEEQRETTDDSHSCDI